MTEKWPGTTEEALRHLGLVMRGGHLWVSLEENKKALDHLRGEIERLEQWKSEMTVVSNEWKTVYEYAKRWWAGCCRLGRSKALEIRRLLGDLREEVTFLSRRPTRLPTWEEIMDCMFEIRDIRPGRSVPEEVLRETAEQEYDVLCAKLGADAGEEENRRVVQTVSTPDCGSGDEGSSPSRLTTPPRTDMSQWPPWALHEAIAEASSFLLSRINRPRDYAKLGAGEEQDGVRRGRTTGNEKRRADAEKSSATEPDSDSSPAPFTGQTLMDEARASADLTEHFASRSQAKRIAAQKGEPAPDAPPLPNLDARAWELLPEGTQFHPAGSSASGFIPTTRHDHFAELCAAVGRNVVFFASKTVCKAYYDQAAVDWQFADLPEKVRAIVEAAE